jgi:hypothetical protein
MAMTVRSHLPHPLVLRGATPVLAGLFLLAHAFVHPWLWAFPTEGEEPPQGESWLLHDVFGFGSGAQTATAVLAWAATASFAIAGVMLLARRPAWRPFGAVGAVLSASAMILDFTPGLVLGLAIDAVILAFAIAPAPSESTK